MGIIQINQIKSELVKNYSKKIDLSDAAKASAEQLENLFLTRALCAYSIQCLTNTEPDIISNSLTDGSGDNGIDAVFFDKDNVILYLVQSKWNHKGDSEPDLGEIKKFTGGVRDLISFRFDKFNDKINRRSDEIEEILYTTKNLKINIVLAYTAINLSDYAVREFDELLREMNDSSDMAIFTRCNQSMLFGFIQRQAETKINLEGVVITEWGKKETPKIAYYGQIDSLQVSGWWDKHGKNLFSKNIRLLLPDSEINSEMENTLKEESEYFWYFNNGITMICDNISKMAANGNNRDYGIFDFYNISIVNGAQTVGTIGKFISNVVENKEQLSNVKIPFRVISVNHGVSSDEKNKFAENVTKRSNRQNRIENRDFVTLDSEQKRIALELKMQGISYMIMRSEDTKIDDSSFDLVESTRALSNFVEIESSTLIHREPGKVWSDLENGRYKRLFNNSTTGCFVWNCVKCQRHIDQKIRSFKLGKKGDERAILSYGEDLISCLIFSKIKPKVQKTSIEAIENMFSDVNPDTLISDIFEYLKTEVVIIGKGISTVFKNFNDCEIVYDKVKNKI